MCEIRKTCVGRKPLVVQENQPLSPVYDQRFDMKPLVVLVGRSFDSVPLHVTLYVLKSLRVARTVNGYDLRIL